MIVVGSVVDSSQFTMDYIRMILCLSAFRFGACFQFSGGSGTNPTIGTPGDVQYRQVVVAPTIPATLTTCRCIPPGSCPPVPTLPTDGTGQIDIRIVNNVSVFKGKSKVRLKQCFLGGATSTYSTSSNSGAVLVWLNKMLSSWTVQLWGTVPSSTQQSDSKSWSSCFWSISLASRNSNNCRSLCGIRSASKLQACVNCCS